MEEDHIHNNKKKLKECIIDFYKDHKNFVVLVAEKNNEAMKISYVCPECYEIGCNREISVREMNDLLKDDHEIHEKFKANLQTIKQNLEKYEDLPELIREIDPVIKDNGEQADSVIKNLPKLLPRENSLNKLDTSKYVEINYLKSSSPNSFLESILLAYFHKIYSRNSKFIENFLRENIVKSKDTIKFNENNFIEDVLKKNWKDINMWFKNIWENSSITSSFQNQKMLSFQKFVNFTAKKIEDIEPYLRVCSQILRITAENFEH